jgi:hypothetical protein
MKFNGILIQNLFHFKTIFNDLKNEIQTKSCDFIFQFDDDSIIVIDGHLAVQSGEQVRYCYHNIQYYHLFLTVIVVVSRYVKKIRYHHYIRLICCNCF